MRCLGANSHNHTTQHSTLQHTHTLTPTHPTAACTPHGGLHTVFNGSHYNRRPTPEVPSCWTFIGSGGKGNGRDA